MQIIPAIDVLDGSVVRLQQGNFRHVSKYELTPLSVTRLYQNDDFQMLHLVNLNGARDGILDFSFLECIRDLKSSGVIIQAGGGVRSLQDIFTLLDAGADRIVIGSLALTDPQTIRDAILLSGKDKIVIALDCLRGKVKIQGWKTDTGVPLNKALKQIESLGALNVLITDIKRDGMKSGPNLYILREAIEAFPNLNITASGGIRGPSDIRALQAIGCESAIIGKTLLDGDTTLSALMNATNQKSPVSTSVIRNGLTVRIVPCLDIQNGRVVKGTAFQNLNDAGDPVELATRYCSEGADELVFLDITATIEDRMTLIKLVQRIANAINIPFTVGGGIQSLDDTKALLDAGADKVSINTAAVRKPSLLSDIANTLGSANTVCAIDAKQIDNQWRVMLCGGREDCGIDVLQWAKDAENRGAGELLVTSYDRDGTKQGFDLELIRCIKERVSIPVIASGGAGRPKDFVDAANAGADALLAASVFHYGKLSICDVKKELSDSSIPVRL